MATDLVTIQPFPFRIGPLTNITPFTYADGATYLEILYGLKDYIQGKLRPELEKELNRIIAEFNTGITNAEKTITDALQKWEHDFAAFIADVINRLEGLNDEAVRNLVNDPNSDTGSAIRVLINSIAISHDEIDHEVAEFVPQSNSEIHNAILDLIDLRNSATLDPSVAALVNNLDSLTRQSIKNLIDSRNAETIDDLVSAWINVPSLSQTAVDNRVKAIADDTVSNVLRDDKSKTRQDVLGLIEGQAVKSSGNGYVNIGGTRRGIDSVRYSAFPSVTKLRDGRLFMVYTESTDHIQTRDGIVIGAFSQDDGQTWSPKQTLVNIPGIDLRDPTVSTTKDGSILFLTYIKATAAKPRDGFYLRRSLDNGVTWGGELRIDPVNSNGAGTSPIIELSSGELFATWFGMENGETFDSSYYAKSNDKGLTWSARTKLKDGQLDARSYPEPYAQALNDSVTVMYRHGNDDSIGVMTTSNNGQTWTSGRVAFRGSGRPNFVFTSEGTLVVVYRNNDSPNGINQHGMMRTSKDLGRTWSQPRLVELAIGGWWNYSGLLEVVPGQILCVSAIEISFTRSELSSRYLTEGSASNPFGDVPADMYERSLTRSNSIAVVDSFDRPDAASLDRSENGVLWANNFSQAAILNGAAQNPGDGVVGLNIINVRTPNVEIECEMSWLNNSGCAVVFRYLDNANYYMAAIEAQGGKLNVYSVVGGAATQVLTSDINIPSGLFHKMKVTNLNGVVRVYVEDIVIHSSIQAGGASGNFVGFRLGVATFPNAIHRVRNFIVHRRSGFAN